MIVRRSFVQFWTYRGLRGGVKTTAWPLDSVDGVTGLPEPNVESCVQDCELCASVCPTGAITLDDGVEVDHGACIACNLCVENCPVGVLTVPENLTLARTDRDALRRRSIPRPTAAVPSKPTPDQRHLSKSLFVRHIDCGSCNGCESEVAALDNPYYNLHRFGIFFTPSPRFADVLLVTGPVTNPMYEPLLATYEAMGSPKYVVATGVCAISGGTNGGGYNAHRGLEGILPVDLWVPGCPPHPAVLIDALLGLVGR
jgi:Ni,Fe-hydrogenase III small subunit/NAD-dependent dihydropyrimidine dehydrogenase PreA subunit